MISAKTLNFLGIIIVFFGLFTLMFMHLNHQEASQDASHWLHLAIGFPASVVGALLLILAEKQTPV